MIRWITERLGTAPKYGIDEGAGVRTVDVRELVDKPGNLRSAVRAKIDQGVALLRDGHRVVICCDQGISRSNAIASGVLAQVEGISVNDALRMVREATGETQVKLELLDLVRSVFAEDSEVAGSNAPSKGRRVLLTGGNGFLGGALPRAMSDVCDVTAPSRKECDVASGLVDLALLAEERSVTHVLHFASPVPHMTNAAMGQSLTMLRNVLDVCRSTGARLVYPSSWEVFSGYRADRLIATEKMSQLPKGIGGETKWLAERLIRLYHQHWGVEYAIIRSGITYGPGPQRKPAFVHAMIDKAKGGEIITTHRYENGSPLLDILHIEDYAEAVRKIVDTNFTGVVHVGSGSGITSRGLATLVVDIVGAECAAIEQDVDDYTANIVMNTEVARMRLKWQPQIDLDAGLRELITSLNGQ